MGNKNNKITTHHIIPKSCGGTNYGANKLELTDVRHRALHTLFANDAPHEQIGRIVDMTGRAFNNCFKDDIRSVINDYDIEDIYRSKCVRIHKLMLHILDTKNG